MNVTNIGFPMPNAAPQAGTVDAAGSGFAGLLGTMPVDGGQGQPMLGLTGTTPELGAPLLAAQTSAPLLPSPASPVGTPPADRPQVAIAQLLATSAPSAMGPPVATGGNPLADAVARALAAAQGKATDAAALPEAAGALSTAPVAAPAQPSASAAQPKPSIAQPAPTIAQPESTVAQPKPTAAQPKPTPTPTPTPNAAPVTLLSAIPANDAQPVAPNDAAALPAVSVEQRETALPIKIAARRSGSVSSADPDPAGAMPPVPDAAAATAAVAPPPLALATVQPQPIAQPAAPQPAAQNKTSAATASRPATVDTVAATGTVPAPAAGEETAGPVRTAAIGPAHGGASDGGTMGDGAQPSFGQQLAAADTHAAGTVPLAGTPAALPAATPSAAAAPAAETVVHARPGELGRTLGVEIARKVEAGEDTLRVRLNPAELGRVEVTLAFDDKGRVQATMRAESQHTLELLRQDAPDLGRALDQAGIRSDASSFRFESRDGGSASSGGNGQSGGQQQSRGGNRQFRDEPEVQTAAYRPIRGDGQVDLIA